VEWCDGHAHLRTARDDPAGVSEQYVAPPVEAFVGDARLLQPGTW
jgi:hypothetical protein